jgi:glycosyltransferase involved in cell wall biosynthesis
MRIYYWIHHTGEYAGNTGVQRVVRNLAAALTDLGLDVVLVRWCAERDAIVHADRRWGEGLSRYGGPSLQVGRDEGEPIHLAAADHGKLAGAWLLLPEVPHVAGPGSPNLAVVFDYARFYGLRSVGIFYDLVPLRRPGYEALVPDHERYARALVAAELLLAISHHSGDTLRKWWEEAGYDAARLPRLVAIPLPAEIVGIPRVTAAADPPTPPVRFFAFGTLEPRKNQIEAMRAFARVRARRPDLDLYFDLVGNLHGDVAEVAESIARSEPRIRLHGYLPDAEVHALTHASHATVFLSLEEGYGLPVAESLWQGKPCLSSNHGAVAEVATGGGCWMVDAYDPVAIELGFERLAEDRALRLQLADAACARRLRTWQDYGREIANGLAAMPLLDRVVVIEGSQNGGAGLANDLVSVGATVRRLHWRSDSRALLPGSASAPEQPALGAGQLQDEWAVLPAASCAGATEAKEIIATANGLGLRVALEAGADASSELLAAPDLALFHDDPTKEAALARALCELPKTVALRARFRTGTGVAALPAIAAVRPRITAAGAPQRPSRLFYWVGLTVTQPFNTGVQRVTRLLSAALERQGVDVVPVKWDEEGCRMVHLSEEEGVNLARWNGPRARPPQPLPQSSAGEWLLLPEITVPLVPPASNVAQLGRSLGMRTAALFYDLIPEKMPEVYPPGALANMRTFWKTFGSIDLALPISWTSAADLLRYMTEQGMRLPTIIPCPLAGDIGATPRATHSRAGLGPGEPLRLLAVGTWEPRKNYPRLLRALAVARARAGRPIVLTIVGRRAGYDELDADILRAAESLADLRDHVSDDELLALYQAADATVFASWEEGFGLPVVESLWHGRPCLCHSGSAMAEVAAGGGVLAADMLDEAAITQGLLRLADEPEVLAKLGAKAVTRPIRTWDEYAEDVLRALSRTGVAPGWPLPAIARRRPLLSCAITTYNRARWLTHSLPRVLEATRQWRDVVEVVVCDNASTDDTPAVVARFANEPNFLAYRNPTNVGMLGNLGVTARHSRGAFVWLLGDDDLLADGAIENVLEGLAAHPDVEMAYMNYAYTRFDDPEQLADARDLVAGATPIAPGGPNRHVAALREVAGLNENLFTAIYACAFRRDHALRAYGQDTRGSPFSSLATCVPSSVYALAALQDRPAWWVGEPALVVNMNVSWLRWALLWHLERMPDLFEEAERQGIDATRLDRYRLQHLVEAEQWVRAVYFHAEDAIRCNFSMARLLERCKHLDEFRERHLAGVRQAYADAWDAGRVVVDPVPPDELFSRYGLADRR